MRSGRAFTFIGDLIGDIAHKLPMLENPGIMAFDAAFEVLRAGSNAAAALIERQNRRKLENSAWALVDMQVRTYAEQLKQKCVELERGYAELRLKLENQQFREQNVQKLAKSICEELKRLSEQIQKVQADLPEKDSEDTLFQKERDRMYELERRAVRAYRNLYAYILGNEGM